MHHGDGGGEGRHQPLGHPQAALGPGHPRSATPTVHLLYDRFSIARELQTQMWAQLCKRTARMARGVVMSNVQVQTSRSEPV